MTNFPPAPTKGSADPDRHSPGQPVARAGAGNAPAAGGKLIRVFPRRTKATPTDPLARVGDPDLFDQADQVHISVTFSWDLPEAERLEKLWRHVAPTAIGGPATGARSDDFTPGLYLKPGYTITSRGCPNHCWFCSVPKREGQLRELQVTPGWNVLDDNLLACSIEHLHDVFTMLDDQPQEIHLTGGLEAKRLTPAIAQVLRTINPRQLFFAYDTPDDLEPLRNAGALLTAAGFPIHSHRLRAYVLCGYPADTISDATARMHQTIAAGFLPMAMLYRDPSGATLPSWRKFQRIWARPALTCATLKTQ